MSETGFRQEQKAAERPKPSPRDSNKSSNWDSSPSSPGSTSASQVQILPESKLSSKPTKPERNFSVRYDPNPTAAVANVGPATKPERSVSPDNSTSSVARPVPRPRPRSMVLSHSEPTSLSIDKKDASSDKLAPPVCPEPATRPALPVTKPAVLRPVAPKGHKSYHVVGSSVWYDGGTNVPPRRPPPVVKPKPAVTPTSNETDKTAKQVTAKIPPDVGRRKPTIIRPTSSAEPTAGLTFSTVALQGQTTVTSTTTSTSVASDAETNGWKKPASCTQSDSTMVDGVGVKPATEGFKPQPKKRPTVIRMSRATPSDSECTSELPSNGQLLLSSSDQEQSRALLQSSVAISHGGSVNGLKSKTAAVADSQPTMDHGIKQPGTQELDHGRLVASCRLPSTQESEDRHLKSVSPSQLQLLHLTESDLDVKVPPAKPPPPKPQNMAQEQNSAV